MKVDSDHMKTANVNIFLPPYFLAALPPNIYKEYFSRHDKRARRIIFIIVAFYDGNISLILYQ